MIDLVALAHYHNLADQKAVGTESGAIQNERLQTSNIRCMVTVYILKKLRLTLPPVWKRSRN